MDRLWMKFLDEPLSASLTVLFTFLIFVVTTIYTVATIAYTRVSGRQLRVMKSRYEFHGKRCRFLKERSLVCRT